MLKKLINASFLKSELQINIFVKGEKLEKPPREREEPGEFVELHSY